MSVPRKIAYNVFASSTAKILSTAAALVGLGFITRYLGTDGFGKYTIALAFFALFGALGDFGLYQITTREISEPGADEEKILGNAAALRLVISACVLVLTPLIVPLLHYPVELKLAIILVSFAYVFSSFYQVLIGLFQKRLLMDRVTIAEFFGKVLQVVLIIVGIKLHWGFYFIVGTLLFNMLTNFLVIIVITRRLIHFRLQWDPAYLKSFLRQSLPLGLAAIVSFIYFKADSIMLSFFQPAEDVGMYGAAYKVIENISFFPAMIVGLTMPLFTFHISANFATFKDIVNKNFKVFLILVIPLVVGTQFLADGIINLIAGPDFHSSATILRIIILALAFIFFGNLFNNVLIAAKLQKHLLFILAFCAVFNVATNLIFIPKYSYYATAVTSVATELLVVVLSLWVMIKYVNFIPRTNKIGLMLLSGALMGGFLWFFQTAPFFLLVGVSPVIYFGSLVIFHVISKEELLSLISKNPRIE